GGREFVWIDHYLAAETLDGDPWARVVFIGDVCAASSGYLANRASGYTRQVGGGGTLRDGLLHGWERWRGFAGIFLVALWMAWLRGGAVGFVVIYDSVRM